MASRRKSVTSAISADAAADEIIVVVAAGQRMVLYNLEVTTESNADVVQPLWTLECPASTTRLQGHAPSSIYFGAEGWLVTNAAAGDDVEVNIGAAASGLKTTVSLVYELIDDPDTI